MKKRKERLMYIIWIALYVGCVLLSLVDSVQGGGLVLIRIASLLFFVPGAVLAGWGVKDNNKRILKTVRIVCLTSLVLTTVVLVANFLSVGATAQTGRIWNGILLLVSAPMSIVPFWALSLFLWACLLMMTFPGVMNSNKKK